MTPLSVVVITFNESAHIARCLESVRSIADEVVVLDSGSTDDTVAIARSFGATVHTRPFEGYIEQKNHALGLATHPFILSLDADEALDASLAQSILNEKANPAFRAYRMNRCTNYCGRFIKHGSWYPDTKIRLFDKRYARWGGVNPHDKIILDQEVKTGWLHGDLLHYSYPTLESHIIQNNRFSSIAALSYFERGKKPGYGKMIFSPIWAFLQSYLFRRGFLDGFLGFVIAGNIAHATFMKYYKLKALYKGISIK
jgi:glycosyltransferase involved in cell wall biosynthesis